MWAPSALAITGAMQKTISWLRYLFLGVFAVLTIAVWTYQIVWVQPRTRCEQAGRWWDGQTRSCAIPVSVSIFTGRATPLEIEAAKARAKP